MNCNITLMHAEKNDPEFVFYDVTKSTVHIYRLMDEYICIVDPVFVLHCCLGNELNVSEDPTALIIYGSILPILANELVIIIHFRFIYILNLVSQLEICYSVKPAVFDLVLTCIIAAYLTLVYFMIQVLHTSSLLCCTNEIM